MSFIKPAILSVILIFVLSTNMEAQNSFGVSANYSIAASELGQGAKNGFGATIHYIKAFDEYVSLGVSVGYVNFANKNTDSKISPLINGTALQIIPVTLDAKVYFGSIIEGPGEKKAADEKTWRPFVGVDVGWATANMKLVTNSKNYFTGGPQIGVDYRVNDNFKIRFNVMDNLMIYNRLTYSYDIISWTSLNVGGIFKF